MIGRAGTTTRALVTADLGLAESVFVNGSVSVRAGKMAVYIDQIAAGAEGLGFGVFRMLQSMKLSAAAEGANTLRVETSVEETGRL